MSNVVWHSLRVLCVSSMLPAALSAQTLPDSAATEAMRREEAAFLRSLPAGLQQRQCAAVRAAMRGDDTELRAIRASRSVPPELPADVAATYVRPSLCLFAPRRAAARPRPVLLYLHGGGWAFGSIHSCARFCAAVALAGDCCVAALDYRLSPEHPYPAALDDTREAYDWLRANGAAWGCDTTRISIGGDSAGGNLALAAALTLPGVCSVVPIYPVLKAFPDGSASWQRYGTGYGDDADLLTAFCEAYAGAETANPLVSPALADDEALRRLPPVLLVSAGHDVLADQAAEFAARLRSLGVSISYRLFPAATHLFVTVPGQPTAFAEAVSLTATFLRSSASMTD